MPRFLLLRICFDLSSLFDAQCATAGTCDLDVAEVWITQYVAAHPSSDCSGATVPAADGYTVSLYFILVTMVGGSIPCFACIILNVDFGFVVQATVGYGDIHPANDIERAFMCAVLLITALSYAVIFGNVAVQIQQLDKVWFSYLPCLRLFRCTDWLFCKLMMWCLCSRLCSVHHPVPFCRA